MIRVKCEVVGDLPSIGPGVSALEPLESTPWKFLNGDCIENGALEKVFPFEYGYLG